MEGKYRWRYKISSKDVLPLSVKAGSSTESLGKLIMVFKIQNQYLNIPVLVCKYLHTYKLRNKP